MPQGYVCMAIPPTPQYPTPRVYYSEVPLSLSGSHYQSSFGMGSHTHKDKEWVMKYYGINMLAWLMRLRSAINHRGFVLLSSSESSIRQAVGHWIGGNQTASGLSVNSGDFRFKGKPIQYFSVNRFGGKVAVANPAF